MGYFFDGSRKQFSGYTTNVVHDMGRVIVGESCFEEYTKYYCRHHN
jgi:hypothetical protein